MCLDYIKLIFVKIPDDKSSGITGRLASITGRVTKSNPSEKKKIRKLWYLKKNMS